MATAQKNTNGKPIEDEEEQFTPVGDGVNDLLSDHGDRVPDGDDEDESLGGESSEESEERGDSRVSSEAQGDDDDERERLRSFRRKRRKNARENVRRDRMELNFLRDQNEALERRLMAVETRTQGTEIATIESRISGIREQIRLADQVIAGAIESTEPGRGNDVVKAQGIRDQLVRGLIELENYKKSASGKSAPPEQEERSTNNAAPTPQLSEVQKRRAGQWFKENSWFNVKSKSPEVLKALEIDRQIAAEGFKPSSEEYWDEFEDRVKEALPDLYTDAGDDGDDDDADDLPPLSRNGNSRDPQPDTRNRANGNKPRGPKFRVGGKERPLKNGEVYISPERRKALEDAGMWEDPKLRNRMLKRYNDYDRPSSRRSS